MDLETKYILITLVVIGALTDIRENKIPNILTIPFSLCALIIHSFNSGMSGFVFSVVGILAGLGLLIFPYILSGMGAGDVKLMGAAGSFLGAKATLEAFIVIGLVGGIYSLGLILFHRNLFGGVLSEKLFALSSMLILKQYVPIRNEKFGQKPRLKYGIAIAFGTLIYLWLKSIGINFFV